MQRDGGVHEVKGRVGEQPGMERAGNTCRKVGFIRGEGCEEGVEVVRDFVVEEHVELGQGSRIRALRFELPLQDLYDVLHRCDRVGTSGTSQVGKSDCMGGRG